MHACICYNNKMFCFRYRIYIIAAIIMSLLQKVLFERPFHQLASSSDNGHNLLHLEFHGQDGVASANCDIVVRLNNYIFK